MDTQYTNDPIVQLNVKQLQGFVDQKNKIAVDSYGGQMADYKRQLTQGGSPIQPAVPKLLSFDGAGYAAALSDSFSKIMDAAMAGQPTEGFFPVFENFITKAPYVPPVEVVAEPPKGKAAPGAEMGSGSGLFAEQPGDTSPDGATFPPAPLPPMFQKHVRANPFGGRAAWWQSV